MYVDHNKYPHNIYYTLFVVILYKLDLTIDSEHPSIYIEDGTSFVGAP